MAAKSASKSSLEAIKRIKDEAQKIASDSKMPTTEKAEETLDQANKLLAKIMVLGKDEEPPEKPPVKKPSTTKKKKIKKAAKKNAAKKTMAAKKKAAAKKKTAAKKKAAVKKKAAAKKKVAGKKKRRQPTTRATNAATRAPSANGAEQEE